MIALDRNADTFPVGLAGTPFEEVYRALRVVAASVWAVDPTVYRAGMAWGWYALHAPSALFGFRDVVTAALISEMAPMVKASQTDAELVEYLRQWREYTPTFPKLQALYVLFGVVVDIQPISDPEGQALLPVDDTRLAFYIFVLSMDWSRPMLLGEIAETARRASPLGARPFVVYLVEGLVSVPVAIAPTDGFLWVDVWESAVPVVAPDPSVGDIITFGNYPQSTSTPEPIEWKVLEVDTTNRKALLLSVMILDACQYGASGQSVYWSGSIVRSWLNSTFLNAAFDASEQGRIATTHLETPENPSYHTSGGPDTDDKLFYFTIQDALNTAYFANNAARKADWTIYASGHASYHGGWPLRQPGRYYTWVAYVSPNGSVDTEGVNAYSSSGGLGVRPALWMTY